MSDLGSASKVSQFGASVSEEAQVGVWEHLSANTFPVFPRILSDGEMGQLQGWESTFYLKVFYSQVLD